jgi:hypothetical protein
MPQKPSISIQIILELSYMLRGRIITIGRMNILMIIWQRRDKTAPSVFVRSK